MRCALAVVGFIPWCGTDERLDSVPNCRKNP